MYVVCHGDMKQETVGLLGSLLVILNKAGYTTIQSRMVGQEQ